MSNDNNMWHIVCILCVVQERAKETKVRETLASERSLSVYAVSNQGRRNMMP